VTAVVELDAVVKRFAGRAVVDGVSLTVAAGRVLALLGPSGSGKSTTLRLVAGLEDVDGGRVLLDGREVSAPGRVEPPEQRRVGFVFQSFALFPHLSVAENVAFGARDRRRAAALVDLVHLGPRRDARIHTLSGGEQQRVALARALASQPRVVLLDEPFANLDAALRRHLRDEVATALRASAATAMLVTHDAGEAFALADEVAVMSDGRVLQRGAPEEVYARPASLDIAQRTGEVVRLAARVTAVPTIATTALGPVPLARPAPAGATIAVLRPEQLVIDAGGAPARVVRRVFEGASTSLGLEIGGEPLVLRAAGPLAAAVGETVPVVVRGPALAF
jgi:iron(III) transport system ATP-binding protein